MFTFFEACWSIRIMQSVQFHYFPPNDKLWNNNERWIKCSVKIRICWLEQVLRIDFNVCISKSRIDLMNFPHKMMHFLQFEYGYSNSQSFKHEVGTAGNNVIKCFCSLFYALENKLVFWSCNYFHLNQIIADKGSLPGWRLQKIRLE